MELTAGPLKGSAKLPVNSCKDFIVDINTTKKSIAVNYKKAWGSARSANEQMYIDVAGRFDAINATVMPKWADNNFVMIGVCKNAVDCAIIGEDRVEKWLKKDSGW